MAEPNERLYGFYRAKVVENRDPDQYGRVMIWIPVIMPEVSEDTGLWARPANNPMGGRNKREDDGNYYTGSSFIPKKGSWLLIFFESGNINNPYYFCGLDLENTKVLPENQKGSNYELKWTLFKSHDGRCIVISDDPDDCRVEITGKKRQITNPPSGDTDSVYPIDYNQNSILMDERKNKEKILIRTYKGDFIHIDIDSRKLQAYFANDILIQTGGSLHVKAAKNIRMEAGEDMYQESRYVTYRKAGLNIHDETTADYHNTSVNANITASSNINYKASSDFFMQSGTAMNIKSGALLNIESGAALNIKSGAALNLQSAAITNITCGAALQASATIINMLSSSTVAITGSVGGMSTSGAGMEMEVTGNMSLKATGIISLDGSKTHEQCGTAVPATPATSSGDAGSASEAGSAEESKPAKPDQPIGERDT